MYNEIVIIGVIISLIYYELTGLSPAGLVVPGYLALSLHSPLRLAQTIVIVLLTWLIIKVLSRYLVIFGQRRFALMIMVSFLLSQLLNLTIPFSPGVIGYVVPGIMANQFERQGVLLSMTSLTIVSGMLVLIMYLFNIPVFS